MKIKKAIEMTQQKPNEPIYHVTKDKKTLQHKKLIETLYPNIKVMTEQEWLVYVYKHLKPEDQKRVRGKLKDQQEIKEILGGK